MPMPRVSEQSSRENPMVSVAMITYNHEKFITKAIESVLMQEADFTVELIIGEDCSTDKTRHIVIDYARKYPNVIRALLPEHNLGPTKNSTDVDNVCCGKYIAFLEGDDYWLDSQKLKIQVEWLEKESSCMICAHRYMVLEEETQQISYDPNEAHFGGQPYINITYQNFLNPFLLQTLTVMYRRKGLKGFSDRLNKADSVRWSHLLSQGGVGTVLNRFMGVYRKHGAGMYTQLNVDQQHMFGFEQMQAIVTHEGFASKDVKDTYGHFAKVVYQGKIEKIRRELIALENHVSDTLNGLPIGFKVGGIEKLYNRLIGFCGRLLVVVLKLHWKSISQGGTKRQFGFGHLFLLCQFLFLLVAALPLFVWYFCIQIWRTMFRLVKDVLLQ